MISQKRTVLYQMLTNWGRVTHICVSKLTIIASDNGLSPGRRQAIIWTSAGILLNRPLGTNFNEMLIKILAFSFMKMRLKVSSAKLRSCCIGLNVLTVKSCLDVKNFSKACISFHWAKVAALPADRSTNYENKTSHLSFCYQKYGHIFCDCECMNVIYKLKMHFQHNNFSLIYGSNI